MKFDEIVSVVFCDSDCLLILSPFFVLCHGCNVKFNMLFSFVMAGWEGSAHDSRLLDHARRNPELRFPKPQPG